jgi:hypothetical protein
MEIIKQISRENNQRRSNHYIATSESLTSVVLQLFWLLRFEGGWFFHRTFTIGGTIMGARTARAKGSNQSQGYILFHVEEVWG